jgi:RHS repeat-associated protein
MNLGNGLSEQWTYNSRLQPISVSATNPTTNASVLSLTLGYSGLSSGLDNNGNLLSQTISNAGLTTSVSQSYTYDSANRVTGFTEGSASQQFSYDNYGNMTYVSSTGMGSWPQQPAGFDGNNRNTPNTACTQQDNGSGWRYDCGGNVLRDLLNQTYAFDAENRMTAYCAGQTNPAQCTNSWTNGDVVYSYDGDGRRVQTTDASGTVTTYVYDASGQLAAEYGGSTAAKCSSANPASPGGTCYVMVDHLGSTRVVTNDQGTPVQCEDYLPFGADVPSSVSGRSGCYQNATTDPLQFTGKERDSETGLDYFGARYFASAQGRFTSPDPLVWTEWQRGDNSHQEMFTDFIANPQNFNQYAYVLNNPLASTDPSGLYTCSGTEQQCKNVEAQLVEARKSDNSKVSRAAAAYGAAGVDNGVGVSFSDKQASGQGNTGFVNVVNGKTGESSTRIDVVLSASQFSSDAAANSVTAGATVVHEGSHVADDQAYLLLATFPGLPNEADITHFQSEVGAYLTGSAFIAEHGGRQSSPALPGVPLNSQGTIGIFLHVAPSGNPPYRAYPDSVLRSPISR